MHNTKLSELHVMKRTKRDIVFLTTGFLAHNALHMASVATLIHSEVEFVNDHVGR